MSPRGAAAAAVLAFALVPAAVRPAAADGADTKVVTPNDSVTIPPVFEQLFADRVRRIKEMAASHPQLYQSTVRKMQDLARELEILRTTNLEKYERRMRVLRLEGEAEALAVKWRAATDPAQKDALAKTLRLKLEAVFDLHLEDLRQGIEQQEKELGRLKDRLQKREAARQRIIDRHLKDLQDTDEDLEF